MLSVVSPTADFELVGKVNVTPGISIDSVGEMGVEGVEVVVDVGAVPVYPDCELQNSVQENGMGVLFPQSQKFSCALSEADVLLHKSASRHLEDASNETGDPLEL
ncbi:hypothetical protein HY733_02645 [Candidatus Uhrbacteria bacterium]|nr:hypothetical protein [Candidatus Uhrbacteria bacterium]